MRKFIVFSSKYIQELSPVSHEEFNLAVGWEQNNRVSWSDYLRHYAYKTLSDFGENELSEAKIVLLPGEVPVPHLLQSGTEKWSEDWYGHAALQIPTEEVLRIATGS